MNSHNRARILQSLLVVLLVISTLSFSACSSPAQSTAAPRTTYQMSTVVLYQQISGPDAEAICDELQAVVGDFEQDASMFLTGSEIWAVNNSAGIEPVAVSEDVYYVIERSVACGVESDGLFDVTIGPLSRLWDVTSDDPSVPQQEDIEEALALVDYRDILLNADDNTVLLARPGQVLDLGGIAKGYALDLCRRVLDERGATQGLISIGGNVLVYKDKNGEPFVVGIRYPVAETDGYFCALEMADSVISTTGGYERYFEQDGVTYQHVLDPRTGWPVQGDILSVSVILPDGLTADYMSTRMFVGGLDYTLALMRDEGVPAIVVAANNTVYVSASLQTALVMERCDTETYTFEFV